MSDLRREVRLSSDASLPEIYIFVIQRAAYLPSDVAGAAVAQDGTRLATHVSSSEDWLRHDLGLTTDQRHEVYLAHYPAGFCLVWVNNPESDARTAKFVEPSKPVQPEKHCPTCICGKRAPVQKSSRMGPGTIAWEEHLLAYADYARHYGTEQAAQQIADRGGFGYRELIDHLGREPKTWEPTR